MDIYTVIRRYEGEDRLEFIAASEPIALGFRNLCREQARAMGDADEFGARHEWRVEVWPAVESEQEMKAKAKFPCNMNPREYREWQQANSLKAKANNFLNQ